MVRPESGNSTARLKSSNTESSFGHPPMVSRVRRSTIMALAQLRKRLSFQQLQSGRCNWNLVVPALAMRVLNPQEAENGRPFRLLGNRKVAACGYLANMRLPPHPFMPTLYVAGTTAVTCDEYALWTPPVFTAVTT